MPAMTELPPEPQWWLATAGQPTGPWSVEVILTKVRSGEATPASLVCPVGGTEWKAVADWQVFADSARDSTPKAASSRFSRPLGRRTASNGKAVRAAFKLIGLGILLGALAGGGLLAWWWFGGSPDLPREARYLPAQAKYVFLARPGNMPKQPLALQLMRSCLQHGARASLSDDWEKDSARTFGVAWSYVHMLLMCPMENSQDWLLVLRTDRALSADDLQKARQAAAGKRVRFASHLQGSELIFEEVAEGTPAPTAPWFALPEPSVVLLASRKEVLQEVLRRRTWPRFTPALRAACAQTDFAADFALAERLHAGNTAPLLENLTSLLGWRQATAAVWDKVEGTAISYRRESGAFRAVLLCPTPTAAEAKEKQCRNVLAELRKPPADAKETAPSRAALQGLAVTRQEQLVQVQGTLPEGTP